MQQKFFKEQARKMDAAPDLNQDVINNIATHISYKDGLATLGQTSKKMHELVDSTYAGQLARQEWRDANRHGRYYETLVATPLSWMSIPLALVPATLGFTAGCIGCCLSPLARNSLANVIELSGNLMSSSCRLVYQSPKKTRQLLLKDINRERQEIQDNQESILDELSKPTLPKI